MQDDALLGGTVPDNPQDGAPVAAWLPIETHDGRRANVLLYFPAQECQRLGAMMKVDRYPVSYPRQPTHWIPLPAPPATR